MTREERLELLKQIEKDIYVCSLESTLLDDLKSCAIHSVIEELEQEPRWIPVSERLPEKNGNYLVTIKTSDGTANITFQMVDHFGPGWLHEEKPRKVIAWMPLPKSYKADKEKQDEEIDR